jgi:arsenate reductase-like glutaredoxin family protein
MVDIQIFGLKSSQPTRAAERFFKERRAPIQFVDLKQKPMSRGEIKRFVGRFGLHALLDTEGKAYSEAGLKYLKLSDIELLERIERNPALLRMPLVRCANRLAIGQDEEAWKAVLTPPPAGKGGTK